MFVNRMVGGGVEIDRSGEDIVSSFLCGREEVVVEKTRGCG